MRENDPEAPPGSEEADPGGAGRGGAGAGMPVVPESHRVTRLGEALAAQTGAQDATSPRSVEVPPPAPQPPPPLPLPPAVLPEVPSGGDVA